jgi:uncharacterized Zn finger protein
MNVHLTEEIIRRRASDQSYQKGRDYYQSGAIYNPLQQSTGGGIVLAAQCEGSTEPSYRLRVELDAGGVRSASCTCPYDWGGDCKHIVALLLSFLQKPEEFSEQKSVKDLLAGLEKDSLVALVTRLVERNPDLYDEIEMTIPVVEAGKSKSSPAEAKCQTQVSEGAYRKQVQRILKRSGYGGSYYDDWNEPAYIADLEKVLEAAKKFLEAGDAEGALIILRVLLEETLEDYDGEMDYDGNLAGFIQDLGMPMAEAILSLEMDQESHDALQELIEEMLDDLDDTIEESDLDVIDAALEHGWEELPDQEAQWEEYDEEYWMVLDELQQARLNVLKRQGREDEFLKLAQKADPHRYVLELFQHGQVDEAIKASQELRYDKEMLSIAQKLREAGRLDESIALAERGLDLKGNTVYELATWLAPLEESQGRKEMALLAYRAAYDAHPTIDLYRRIKKLSGLHWENTCPALLKQAGEGYHADVLIDIHLEEGKWDEAIKLAQRDTFALHLLEKVADALIPHRPDWVIQTSFKQAESLITQTQSKLYPVAARWLERAKKAYQHKGQAAEWKAYINNLRVVYAKRPALQRAIEKL